MNWFARLRIRAEELRRESMNRPTAGARSPRKPPAPKHQVATLTLDDPVVKHLDGLLHHLHDDIRKIMASNAELAADLKAVQSQVDKVGTETTTSLAKITELEALLANQPGGTSPEVDAAMAALKASVQVVDDLVTDPNAPPTDPVDPPAEETAP